MLSELNIIIFGASIVNTLQVCVTHILRIFVFYCRVLRMIMFKRIGSIKNWIKHSWFVDFIETARSHPKSKDVCLFNLFI